MNVTIKLTDMSPVLSIFLAEVHEAKSDKPLRFNNVDGITFVGYGHSDKLLLRMLALESLQLQWSYGISQWKEIT